jgi:hypothetical protein
MEEVSLLDLTGKWPKRARASANFNSGPQPGAGVVEHDLRLLPPPYGPVLRLLHEQQRAGVDLVERVTKALPRLPVFNRPLSDAPLLTLVEGTATGLGNGVI